jgi:uncharacterized protein YbaA (DUF1428 family)
MAYVDGFVAAVQTARRAEYEAFCKVAAEVFRDHGALSVVDCWGDEVPEGEMTSFPKAVQCAPDETVVFGWIVWPSKQARQAGMAKADEDPRLGGQDGPMPFDGQRMLMAGFDVIE